VRTGARTRRATTLEIVQIRERKRTNGIASIEHCGVMLATTERQRRTDAVADIIETAAAALRDAATPATLELEEIARWCAEVGGVDPRIERAALLQALALIHIDTLIADVLATLRGRLLAAGPYLPALIERGGVPRMLASLGLDDVEPHAGALSREVPPRVARLYWQRLRAYVSWSASCAWP